MQPNENDTKSVDEEAKEIMEGSSDAWIILESLNKSVAGLVVSTKPVMATAYQFWDEIIAFIDPDERAGFEAKFNALKEKLTAIAQKVPELGKLHAEGKGHPQEGDNLMAIADQYTQLMDSFGDLERDELHIVTSTIHAFATKKAIEEESK